MHFIPTLRVRILKLWDARLAVAAFAIIGTIGLFVQPIGSTPVHSMDLRSLVEASDLIVVGQISSVTNVGRTSLDLPTGTATATRFEAALKVDIVLKGPGTDGISIGFAKLDDSGLFRGAISGQYGMFFLKVGRGVWEFSDSLYPALPAARHAQHEAGLPLGQVTTMLGQVLSSPDSTDSDRDQALQALATLDTDLAASTLRRALASASGSDRLDIARTLVARNDISGLGLVETALLHSTGLSQRSILDLAGSLAGIRDPRAIPSLAKLVKSDHREVRRGAATALRQTAAKEALQPLASLLRDPEQMTRYYAVSGLGEITQQWEWAPSFAEFQQHPQKYISHWNQWIEANLR